MTYETLEDLREENTYLREIVAGLTGAGEPPLEGLTKMQSRIVRTLEQANGRILSRDAIIDANYWDHPNDIPQVKIIDVMLHKIRKNRPDIGARLINIWGYGFMIEPEAETGA